MWLNLPSCRHPYRWHRALINAFKQETGVPVVLNRGFNENEPMAQCAHAVIVCNPGEAVSCLLRTKMDALAIGNFLVEKEVGLAG